MRLQTLSLAALAVLMMAPAAFARPDFGDRHHGRGGGPLKLIEKHAADLGIDAATQDEIKALAKESRAAGKALREQAREAKELMRDLMLTGSDEQVIDHHREISRIKAQMHEKRVRLMLQIRKRLTPDQWREAHALLAQHRADRRAQRGERKQRRQRGDRDQLE